MNYQIKQTSTENTDQTFLQVIMEGQVVASGLYNKARRKCSEWIHNPNMLSQGMINQIQAEL